MAAAEDSGNGGSVSSCIPGSSIRSLSEMCGLSSVSEDACQWLGEQAEFRVRVLVQQAQKFARHSKRRRLAAADVASALRQRRVEPQLGADYYAALPLHSIVGPGNRRHYFKETEEVDLAAMASQELPAVPVGACVKAHWLCIDGCQPATAENPPPPAAGVGTGASADSDRGVGVGGVGGGGGQSRPKSLWELTMRSGQSRKLTKEPDMVRFKDIGSHELSREQQMFFREISEACVGSQEDKRTEALNTLATDSGLQQILPRLVVFIVEGVRINSLTSNLALLIYLMRMVAFLLNNPHLQLERFLHLLLPSILTCVLGRQLCQRPEVENHWALRDFSAKQLGTICSRYTSPSNQLSARVCRLLADYMHRQRPHLASLYGCVVCVLELGQDAVASLLLPLLPRICQRLEAAHGKADSVSVGNIRRKLVDQLPSALCHLRAGTDSVDEYIRDYGGIGADLFTGVQALQAKGKLYSH